MFKYNKNNLIKKKTKLNKVIVCFFFCHEFINIVIIFFCSYNNDQLNLKFNLSLFNYLFTYIGTIYYLLNMLLIIYYWAF